MADYLLAFFGANGSGKTTVAELISRRYGVAVAPKRTSGSVRRLDYATLVEALRCYCEQAAVIKGNSSDRLITSRFGILDVMVYAYAFAEMNLIRPSELDDLAKRCARSFEDWPIPPCLINLTASDDVLLDRLAARDSVSVRSAGSDLRRLVGTVRRIYAAAVGEADDPMFPMLRRILEPCRQRGRIHVLDTTNEPAAETAAQAAELAGLSYRGECPPQGGKPARPGTGLGGAHQDDDGGLKPQIRCDQHTLSLLLPGQSKGKYAGRSWRRDFSSPSSLR